MGSVFGPVRFILPVCRLSWFLYTLNICAHFRCIFLSNYWWHKSDIWSQASYRYPISWEAFLDLSDSYFLFAEERGYHTWALAHSSSCIHLFNIYERLRNRSGSTNMPDYIMTSNFNLRIPKQAWFHCDVKFSQTCPIRSHKRARFYKETTLFFHLMHVYNSVRVSVLLLCYKTIDISEWKV